MNFRLIRPHLPTWLYRRLFRRYTSTAVITDRRPFTDADVLPPGWSPFPFRDGDIQER
jgi:hypothetical protein